MGNKLRWCLRIKDGLRILEPNERLSRSYLKEAKSSLLRAEKNFEEEDMLWTTVVIYYTEYYALYSFLQRIGVKCGNHSCSILAVKFLLGKEKTKTIEKHKERRIDAQYYMKIADKNKIRKMLRDAKVFVSEFDNLVSNLTESEIKDYRKSLMDI